MRLIRKTACHMREVVAISVLSSLVFAGCHRNNAASSGSSVSSGRSLSGTGNVSASPAVETHGINFRDVASERQLLFRWCEHPRPITTLGAFGCGCGFVDFDLDGWQDAFLVGDQACALFRNSQGKQFQEVTNPTGLSAGEARWTGCAVGDYDGDGWLDLLITGFHRLALYHNRGDGTFVDATISSGLDPENLQHWGSSAGFMDLNGDDLLDLVILNYVVYGPHVKQYCELKPGVLSGCPPKEYQPERGEIWRNNGTGGFALAEDAGMQSTNGVGLVLAFADLDHDNRQDFYIGNDQGLADLMHNLGGLRFENIGIASGLAFKNARSMNSMAAMGADWGDYDRDGRFDLTVTDFQMASAAVFHNLGNLIFTDAGSALGIATATHNSLGFGAKWLDLDNDGWLDVCYVNGHVYDNASDIVQGTPFRQPTQLLHSRGGRSFVDLVPSLPADVRRPILGRGSATGDFDNDGRIDVLVVDFEGPVRLLQNLSDTPHHWLTLDLRTPSANRFAYGAFVTAKSGDQLWIGQVSPASSYLSSSDPRLHWGLGNVSRLETLSIRWPSGRETVFRDVAVDRILQIVEGTEFPDGSATIELRSSRGEQAP